MANSKLTALTAITSFSGDELFYVVDDDDGTPVSRKITVEDLVSGIVGLALTSSTWTPTVGSGSGTLTTTSASGRYSLLGDLVFFNLDVTITTNGTGASSITATMPFAALADNNYIFVGREDATAGFILQGKLSGGSSTMSIFKQDNSYPGGSGNVLRLSGYYRKAA